MWTLVCELLVPSTERMLHVPRRLCGGLPWQRLAHRAFSTSPAVPGQLFINNEYLDAEAGASVPVFSPRDGTQLTTIANASAADVNRAVQSARYLRVCCAEGIVVCNGRVTVQRERTVHLVTPRSPGDRMRGGETPKGCVCVCVCQCNLYNTSTDSCHT